MNKYFIILISLLLAVFNNPIVARELKEISPPSYSMIKGIVPLIDWEHHGSVAVLPFTNKGIEDDWYAIAIQELLTSVMYTSKQFDTVPIDRSMLSLTKICPVLKLSCLASNNKDIQRAYTDDTDKIADIALYVHGSFRAIPNSDALEVEIIFENRKSDKETRLFKVSKKLFSSELAKKYIDFLVELDYFSVNTKIESIEYLCDEINTVDEFLQIYSLAILERIRHKHTRNLEEELKSSLENKKKSKKKISKKWMKYADYLNKISNKGTCSESQLAYFYAASGDIKLSKKISKNLYRYVNKPILGLLTSLDLSYRPFSKEYIGVNDQIVSLNPGLGIYQRSAAEYYLKKNSQLEYAKISAVNAYHTSANILGKLNSLGLIANFYKEEGNVDDAVKIREYIDYIYLHGNDQLDERQKGGFDEIINRSKLVFLYEFSGRYSDAINLAPLLENTSLPLGVISTILKIDLLGGVARSYQAMGMYSEANKYYTLSEYGKKYAKKNAKLVSLLKDVGDEHFSRIEADYLVSHSRTKYLIGDYAGAYVIAQIADDTARNVEHPSAYEANILLSAISHKLSRNQEAIKYAQNVIDGISGLRGANLLEISSANSVLGDIYTSQSDNAKSLEYYLRGLVSLDFQNPNELILAGELEYKISSQYELLNKIPLAIAYGKSSVNKMQSVRRTLGDLPAEMQTSFKERVRNIYQHLADLLFYDGKIAMGEQVLRMLKDTERTLYRSESDGKAERLTMAAAEQLALTKISTYLRDSTRFEQLKGQGNRSTSEQSEYVRLTRIRRAGTLEAIVDTLEKAMTVASANPDLNSSSKTAELLKELKNKSGEKAALLYLFISDDKFSHVLITPDNKPLVINTPIDTKELYQRIPLLRRALTPELGKISKLSSADEKEAFWSENHQELMKHSQWLYKEMIGPVQDQLKASGTQTLMVYLDGPLRYLPVAALHGGEKYLLENYKLSLLTGSPEKAIGNRSTLRKLKIAAMGTDEYYQSPEGLVFKSLLAVENELRAVASEHFWEGGSFGGERYFREEFSPRNFYDLSAKGEYPLFHLATHFYMRPGDSRRSFLLFGGPEAVTVDTLIKNWLPKNVEILTLSACSTALSTGGQSSSGDGRGALEVLNKNTSGAEVDSFASSLIIEKNIKTVIATLWNIEDQSAAMFMEKFYTYLPDNKRYTRVGALRQAQLDLLQNKVELSRGNNSALEQRYGLKDYSHPVFWAPFILMGQWM